MIKILLSTLGFALGSLCFNVDIRADSNRDGIVDLVGSSDSHHKTTWTEQYGAIFLANVGDTDRRCSELALQGPRLSNEALAACNDSSDDVQRAPQYMAPLLTLPIPDVPSDALGWITVPGSVPRRKVRVFRQEQDTWIINHDTHAFNPEQLKNGVRLGIDARDVRRPDGWDGRVRVRFTVHSGGSNSTDEVMLRVAPVLTHNHLQREEQVMTVAGNCSRYSAELKFDTQLASIVSRAGIKTPTYRFPDWEDIWAQDFFEPGYTSMPGPNGTVISLRIMIRSAQDVRLSGRQVFTRLRRSGVGALQQLGSREESYNSMGNVETAPPHTVNGKTYAAGRIITGVYDSNVPYLVPFWRAQETQDPILLETGWLLVGHVDEFVQFLPVQSSRGWVIMADDPNAGIELLRQAKADGHGATQLFSRPNLPPDKKCGKCVNALCRPTIVPNTTIDDVLGRLNLTEFNQHCAKKIEKNLAILKEATGIEDHEIHRIPTIFETGGLLFNTTDPSYATKALAFVPAMINGLFLTGTRDYVPPNPWGPVINGADIFASKALAAYGALNITVNFLDDWNSHHDGVGEVHCGTNSIRDASVPWWQ